MRIFILFLFLFVSSCSTSSEIECYCTDEVEHSFHVAQENETDVEMLKPYDETKEIFPAPRPSPEFKRQTKLPLKQRKSKVDVKLRNLSNKYKIKKLKH